MKQKPRLAVLASRFPYPVEKGDKLRLFHQLKGLSQEFDIYLFALTEEVLGEEEREPVARLCRDVFVYQDHHIRRKYGVLRYHQGSWPSQVRYFYSKKIHNRFLEDFFRINADVIYCQLYRMTPYLEGIDAPKVLDVMDSFSSIAALQARHARSSLDRVFWKRESRLINRFEEELARDFAHFTVISERDAESLNLPESNFVSIIRNGIDVDFFQSYPHQETAASYDFAFIGNLDYKPNREGVRYIIRELIPYFRNHGKEIQILIGGKGAEKLEDLYNQIPEVTFHGWYDDIREAYYSAKIFIAPLFLGSGMQNKVLEALASSRPVICSSHVIEAMPMLSNEVYVADNPEEYLQQYELLINDDYDQIKQSRVLSVLKNELSWEAQSMILKKVLHDTRKSYGWNIARYH